jgi:hypothetical protein
MTMSIYQFQYGQGVDEHSGKEKCVSIFIPNHYVGTLKELSKHVSIRVGNSSNLIRIGCWLKQHNSRVIRSICDAIHLAVAARRALQQTFHDVLDVVLIDKVGGRYDYEPLVQALSSYEYFLCDNMPKFISSLKGMDTIECQPIFVKKYITLNYGQQEQRKRHSTNTICFSYNHLINEG